MKNKNDWLLPVGLLVLTILPLLGSADRLLQLWRGAVTAENARFFAFSGSTIAHIVSSNVFSILGALQFSGGIRRKIPGYHRQVGRVLTVCGLVAGSTGVWMTLFYPRAMGDDVLLFWFRLVFSILMIVATTQGYLAIRRRDIVQHRVCMMRGYAICIGSGTQAVVHFPWLLVAGKPDEFARALLLGAGWAINLGIAEWIIRRHTPSRPKPKATPGPSPVPK